MMYVHRFIVLNSASHFYVTHLGNCIGPFVIWVVFCDATLGKSNTAHERSINLAEGDQFKLRLTWVTKNKFLTLILKCTLHYWTISRLPETAFK